MDASDIIRLLNSRHYSPADLEEVNKLCRNFPEFSAAQILKVRIMEALHYDKKQQLKVAAVYSMDRSKLFQVITEVLQETEPEREPVDEPDEIIQFSEESNPHADIIIEQHAPYAYQDTDSDLLELDEESSKETMEDHDETPVDEERLGTGQEPVHEPGEEPAQEPDGEAGDPDHENASGEQDDSQEDISAKEPEEKVSDEVPPIEKNETEMEEPDVLADDEMPVFDHVNQIRKKSGNHLISNFIKEDPGPIRADRETRLKGDVSLDSIREHDGFITDTLARIYVKQGLLAKAIYAYEKLSLKYPEKSAYFAAQIEKIRNLNHS